MATNITQKIYSGIFNFIETNKALLPVLYFPNNDISDIPEDEHILIDIMPSNTNSLGVSDLDYHSGIIQFLINVKARTYSIRASEIADIVLNLMKRNTRIDYEDIRININKTGSVSPPMPNFDWYAVAVTIPYNVIVK
jgi:hypothetical protein